MEGYILLVLVCCEVMERSGIVKSVAIWTRLLEFCSEAWKGFEKWEMILTLVGNLVLFQGIVLWQMILTLVGAADLFHGPILHVIKEAVHPTGLAIQRVIGVVLQGPPFIIVKP